VSSIVEEFKVTKVRTAMLLQHSKDNVAKKTKTSNPSRTRKWNEDEALLEAVERLQHSDIVGIVAEGRKGLGSYGRVSWSKADNETRRKMVQDEVRKSEEERRRVKAISQGSQGAWMNWDGVERRKTSWQQLMQPTGNSLSFQLKAMSDTLPTPANMAR
jgi:hypothetical protein